jgi:hypothetical protein
MSTCPSKKHSSAHEQTTLVKALRNVPCLYAGVADIHVYLQHTFVLDDRSAWNGYFAGAGAFLRILPETVDIAALELPIPASGAPEGLLARAAHTILAGLVWYASGDVRILYQGIENTAWELRLFNRNFFPLILSSAYPGNHPRYVTWRQPVVLLQPEHSFTRHGVSSRNAERTRLSHRTEAAFRREGRRYFAEITRELPKAFRLIKPLMEESPPVVWWKSEPLIALDNPCRDQ